MDYLSFDVRGSASVNVLAIKFFEALIADSVHGRYDNLHICEKYYFFKANILQ